MWKFQDNKLSEHVTQITDPTGVSCFLVTGGERAMLIDTCVGFVGLRKKVEELTSLPYEVLLTHGHGDHAGGAAEFMTACGGQDDAPGTCAHTVYLHPADLPLLGVHGLELRIDYAAGMLGPAVKLAETDFVPEPEPGFAELSDGQVFDLGGITLEIIHVPGHTKGSCCVLMREKRMILYGDACNGNTLVMDQASTGISTYRESLLRLKAFDDAYDTVCYSHGPAIGPRRSLDDNIELCGRILAGTDDAVPCEFMGRAAIRAAATKGDLLLRPELRTCCAAAGEHDSGGSLGFAERICMPELQDTGHEESSILQFERVDGKYGNIVYSELTKR